MPNQVTILSAEETPFAYRIQGVIRGHQVSVEVAKPQYRAQPTLAAKQQLVASALLAQKTLLDAGTETGLLGVVLVP